MEHSSLATGGEKNLLNNLDDIVYVLGNKGPENKESRRSTRAAVWGVSNLLVFLITLISY
jgi:hypothetical protein